MARKGRWDEVITFAGKQRQAGLFCGFAILWEGDDPKDDKKITYRELHAEVCRFANVLKARDVKKGDRVIIYTPIIPEAAVSPGGRSGNRYARPPSFHTR